MENEEEVVEQTTETENTVTDTAEEKAEKVFTQEEMNEISKDRAYRASQRVKSEYERKLSKLTNVLNAGLGTSNLDEATQKLSDFYKKQGVEIPTEAKLTDRQEHLLANAEAQEIINQGYDEVVEEIDRLNSKSQMSSYEKEIFTNLVKAKTEQENLKALKSMGVSEDTLKDKKFREFSNKLNPDLSIKEKYEMYSRFNKPKNIEKVGSMKTDNSTDDKYRDNYTVEEARKFTQEEINSDPKLAEAIEKSMLKWK